MNKSRTRIRSNILLTHDILFLNYVIVLLCVYNKLEYICLVTNRYELIPIIVHIKYCILINTKNNADSENKNDKHHNFMLFKRFCFRPCLLWKSDKSRACLA